MGIGTVIIVFIIIMPVRVETNRHTDRHTQATRSGLSHSPTDLIAVGQKATYRRTKHYNSDAQNITTNTRRKQHNNNLIDNKIVKKTSSPIVSYNL